MGTDYRLISSKIRIPSKNVKAALDALICLGGYYEKSPAIIEGIHHWSHLPENIKLREFSGDAWGFQLTPDADGNIIGVEWIWEKCAEPDMLKALAPFVEGDCFIEMRSDGGNHWRWVIQDGEFQKLYAHTSITWRPEFPR